MALHQVGHSAAGLLLLVLLTLNEDEVLLGFRRASSLPFT
jgi:hypothetical protein